MHYFPETIELFKEAITKDKLEQFKKLYEKISLTKAQHAHLLVSAAAYNSLAITTYLIEEKGMSANTLEQQNKAVLHSAAYMAARCGCKEIIGLFLDKGFGTELLHEAVRMGHTEIVRLFLERGLKVNIHNEKGNTALFSAVAKVDTQTIELLLNRGICIQTILTMALECDGEEIIELLINRGLDIDNETVSGNTMIRAAVDYGSKKIIKLLLNRGVDINTEAGNEVLFWASLNGQKESIQLLLKRDFNISSEAGGNALLLASGNRYTQVVKLLLRKGVFVNYSVVGRGYTALHLAVCRYNGDIELVEELLKYGVSIDARSDNKTALKLAVDSYHNHDRRKLFSSLIPMLIRWGANIQNCLTELPNFLEYHDNIHDGLKGLLEEHNLAADPEKIRCILRIGRKYLALKKRFLEIEKRLEKANSIEEMITLFVCQENAHRKNRADILNTANYFSKKISVKKSMDKDIFLEIKKLAPELREQILKNFDWEKYLKECVEDGLLDSGNPNVLWATQWLFSHKTDFLENYLKEIDLPERVNKLSCHDFSP